MSSLEYTAHVNEDGTLRIINRKKFDVELMQFAGKDVDIVVSKKKRKRSVTINRYYFGVVVAMVRDAFRDLGNEVDSDLTHEFLKGRFHYKEFVDENSGEVMKLPMSTTDMSNTEFIEYIERVKQFASEILSLYIPDPNEQLKIM